MNGTVCDFMRFGGKTKMVEANQRIWGIKERQSGNVRSKFVQVSSIKIGDNRIRFLAMNEDNNCALFPHSVTACSGRLLFLACDVLAGTSVTANHANRVHKRMSANGFAVRLELNGFKIADVNNGGVMWFYSIQGVFRALFEFGDKHMQKDCLEKLQVVWLDSYKDKPVPERGVLNLSDDTSASFVTVKCTCKNCCSKMNCLHQNSARNSADSLAHLQNTSAFEADVPALETSNKYICTNNIEIGCEDDGDEMFTPVRVLRDTSSSFAQSGQSFEVQEKQHGSSVDCFNTILKDFLYKSLPTVTSEIHEDVLKDLMVVLKYLSFIITLPDDSRRFCSMLFSSMEEFVNILHTEENDFLPAVNGFGLTREKSVLLYVLSDWLGKEFRAMEGAVGVRTNAFKQKNLFKIDSLPPNEQLVKTLFPSCMEIFISNWIGGVGSPVSPDHTYTFVNKHESEMKTRQLQLILELGTNCLVSGLSHVVFSELYVRN